MQWIKSTLLKTLWLTLLGWPFSGLTAESADKRPSIRSSLAVSSLLTDIVILTDKRLVAVGERGHVLYSDDAKQWTQAEVPVSGLLTDVFFLDSQQGWAVGHDATIIHTTDGGRHWSIQHDSAALDKPLFGIHFKDPLNGLAFGAYGLFMRTRDGGKQWQTEFHGEFLDPDDLDYLNELKQSEPEIYEDEAGSISPHLNRLLVDGEQLVLVGEAGLVATSSNYGVSWRKLDSFYAGSLFEVAKTAFGLYVTGLRGHVYVRRGPDKPFSAVATEAKTSINRIIATQDKLVLVGNAGLVRVSVDGGRTLRAFDQADGKAITGGVFWQQQLILTSAGGVKVVNGEKW